MPNIFTNAVIVTATKPESKKAKPAEIALAGLGRVAAIEFLIKQLEGVKEIEVGKLKSGPMKNVFVEHGCAAKKRPSNFRGIDGEHSGSCELKIRASSSALSEDEQKTFAEFGLPIDTVTLVEECYRFNPKYTDRPDVLEKAAKALENSKDVPSDLIQMQQGAKRVIVGEGALDALFTLPRATVSRLFDMVGVLALKTKFASDKLDDALQLVRPLLGNGNAPEGQIIEAAIAVAQSAEEQQAPRKRGAPRKAAA